MLQYYLAECFTAQKFSGHLHAASFRDLQYTNVLHNDTRMDSGRTSTMPRF